MRINKAWRTTYGSEEIKQSVDETPRGDDMRWAHHSNSRRQKCHHLHTEAYLVLQPRPQSTAGLWSQTGKRHIVRVEWGSLFFKLDSLNCTKKILNEVARIWQRRKCGWEPFASPVFHILLHGGGGGGDSWGRKWRSEFFFHFIQFKNFMARSCHAPVLSVMVGEECNKDIVHVLQG